MTPLPRPAIGPRGRQYMRVPREMPAKKLERPFGDPQQAFPGVGSGTRRRTNLGHHGRRKAQRREMDVMQILDEHFRHLRWEAVEQCKVRSHEGIQPLVVMQDGRARSCSVK